MGVPIFIIFVYLLTAKNQSILKSVINSKNLKMIFKQISHVSPHKFDRNTAGFQVVEEHNNGSSCRVFDEAKSVEKLASRKSLNQ